MIRMRMGRDEIIELFDLVTLQCIENDFAFAGIARIDQNRLSGGRDDQDRIALTWPNVEHVHLNSPVGLGGRARHNVDQVELPDRCRLRPAR